MQDNQLDLLTNLLIKMIEKSDDHNKEEIKKISDSISSINKNVTNLKEEINKLKTKTELNGERFSAKSKLVFALITFLVSFGAVIIKFKTEIGLYISKLS